MILLKTLAQAETTGNVRCVGKIKTLGICFSSLYSAREIDDNCKGRMKKNRKKNAVFMGKKGFMYPRKIIIFKTLILSNIKYIISSIDLPEGP